MITFLNDGAILFDFNVGVTNIGGLMERLHDLEKGGLKRRSSLLNQIKRAELSVGCCHLTGTICKLGTDSPHLDL